MRKRALTFVRFLGVTLAIFLILQWPVMGGDRLSFFRIAPLALALNLFLIAVPLATFQVFFRAKVVYVAGLVVALAFSVLNATKIHYLSEPVTANDAFIVQLSPFMATYVGVIEVLLVLAFLVVATALFFSFRFVRVSKAMAVVLVLANAGYCYLVIGGLARDFWLKNVIPLHESASRDAKLSGYVLGLVLRLEYTRIHSYENYSRDSVEKALALASSALSVREKVATRRPDQDVVFILLESFYDYYRTNKTWVREDNVPFLRSLMKESQHRYFYAPYFGGGTANSEYEALTGLTTVFSREAVPYEQYVLHKIPSVPAMYKDRGYHTFVIHNNFGSFWARNRVYPLLGFNEFRSMETIRDIVKPTANSLPQDREIFRQSLEILSQPERPPAFHFLITLHSHGPYKPSAAKEYRWAGAGLDPKQTAEFETYLDMIHKTDEDLRWYFAELKKLEHPPTVILFGDHHPYFTQYFLPNASKEDLHKVDVLFWNWKGGDIPTGDTDMGCLAPILARAGFEADTKFFRFLDEFCFRFNSAHDWRERGPEYPKWLEAYGTLTFDRLLGAQYSEK